MSTSTIFIKEPINFRQSLIQIKEKYKEFSPVFSVLLWTFSAMYAASKTNINTNLTGLTVTWVVYDLLLMMLTSTLLYKGITRKNIFLLFPWLGMTIYSLYYNHYLGIMNTITTFKRVKKLTWMPCVNLAMNTLLLIIRVTLTVRVFQFCIHLWFKRKLDEMKKNKAAL